MPTRRNPDKKVDLPPKGSRNRDPITKSPGAHPIEAGVGAALGGAAAGMAAGAAAGPIGAVAGAVVGGIAGGYAGKGVGEWIDPTADDTYLREHFAERPYVKKGQTFEHYAPAYRYGGQAEAKYHGQSFEEIEPELKTGWTKARGEAAMGWSQARDAVRDAYDRTIQLREERLRAEKQPVQTGAVNVRKEVVTETKHIDVPVEREEVVIERRPARGRAAGDIKAEEIRIPTKEEKVRVRKDTVVKEEVSVGKRKVHDTKRVSGTVRKEELKVDRQGSANVRQRQGR